MVTSSHTVVKVGVHVSASSFTVSTELHSRDCGGARLGVLLHSLYCAVLLRVLRLGVSVRGWGWVAILGGWDREDGSNQHQGQGQGLRELGCTAHGVPPATV